MAQQVSGSEKTLLAAVNDEDVPKPPLMRWNAWQQWRSGPGKRPTSAVDGYSTTTQQESALWKAVMLELYGDDWTMSLASADDGDAPVSERSYDAAQAGEPRLTPAAAAGVAPSAEGLPVEESPGSGDAGAAAPPLPNGAKSPGSGAASPVSSWNSLSPGTPSTLAGKVLRRYQPEAESYEKYEARVRRQAPALALGQGASAVCELA